MNRIKIAAVLMPSRAFIVFNSAMFDYIVRLIGLNALTGIHCF